MNPNKLIDHFGKVLTPAILILIFIGSLVKPIGSFNAPIRDYANFPVLKGFLDGYMTMDAIAALIAGLVWVVPSLVGALVGWLFSTAFPFSS